MIIHNRGWGPQIEDALFVDQITGHYRYSGPSPKPDVEKASADRASELAGETAIFRARHRGDADRVCTPEPRRKALSPYSISNAAGLCIFNCGRNISQFYFLLP